jgi:hypothetical protein
MTWHVTTEPCHASVSCFEVHDPGGVEWSHQRCTGPAFERVLFPNLTRASDFGFDLPWFTMRRGGLRLLGPPLGL